MKKMLFCCCCLLLPFFSLSQMHTSIGLIGSCDFINEFAYKFDVKYHEEKLRHGYRFGADFNFRVFDQGFMKTGIRYVKQVYIILDSHLQSGEIHKEYVDEYYLEVPILYRYEFSKRKFSFYSEAGVSSNFYLKGKLVRRINEETTSSDYEVPYLKERRVHLSFVFGVGFNYMLSRKMQLFIQPTYRFYPLIGKESIALTGAYNLGVEFGVRRALSFAKEN